MSVKCRARFVAGLVTAALFLSAGPVAAQSDCTGFFAEADRQVAARLDAVRAELMGDIEARWSLVNELVGPMFDLSISGEQILGEFWQEATEAQRSAFAAAFYDFLLYSFGHLVTEYDDDTLTFDDDCMRQDSPWATDYGQWAQLKLTGSKPETIDIAFVMRRVDGGLRIWDIQYENTSQVRYYRGQFGDRLYERGLDALIVYLREEAELQRERQLGLRVSDAGGPAPAN